MVQAANSIEMFARKNCAALEKRSTTPFEQLYPCKDCDRTFDSFQALGGHRASHMKLRLPHQIYSKTIGTPDGDDRDGTVGGHRSSHMKLRLPHQIYSESIGTNSDGDDRGGMAVTVTRPMRVKLHECRQCQERFTNGQALGGHMRKHAELSAKRKHTDEGFENSLEGSNKCVKTFGVVEESDKKRQRVVLQLDLNFPPVDELTSFVIGLV